LFKYKQPIPKNFYAGGFVYNKKDDTVLLLFRDNKTKIQPHTWSIWGGANEPGENPHDCFIREAEEELGIKFKEDEIKLFTEYLVEELTTYRYVFLSEKEIDPKNLKLGEGGGYAFLPVKDIMGYKLSPRTMDDLKKFFGSR